ncbi:MAG: hypothetical protein ACTSU2_12780 [Promethearchaeota archaeon]
MGHVLDFLEAPFLKRIVASILCLERYLNISFVSYAPSAKTSFTFSPRFKHISNHFINGITFDDAWDIFDPHECAGLYVETYPLFGEYGGGRIEHDPTFIAFYTPGTNWNEFIEGNSVPDYSVFTMIFSIIAGIVYIEIIRRKQTRR